MSGQGFQVGKGFTVQAMSPNPTSNCSASTGASGSLPTGTYYFKYTYVYANGESAPSPSEQTLTLSATGGIILWITSFPTGVNAINYYVGSSSGQESYQGQQTVAGGSANGLTITSLTVGRPLPQYNTTSFQDINPATIGLTNTNEFIIQNLYYNNPIAIGTWDGTTLVMFDGDTGNGAREGVKHRCNSSQWIRACNQNSYSTLQVSFDGIQTQ